MAITRLGGANAITGTIPQGNIANASLGAVTALPAAITTGKVLQVQSTQGINEFSSTSSSFVDVTGLSLTITPTSSSNKILLLANINAYVGAASVYFALRWERAISGGATTGLGHGTYGNSFSRSVDIHEQWSGIGMTYLDTPSTTAEITYQVQGSNTSGSGNFQFSQNNSSTSNIFALEIAG